jgi:hypothetical protein
MTLGRPIKIDEIAPQGLAPSVTDIFTMDNFPAPVGGVITLPSGKYLIKDNLVTSNRFAIGAGAQVTIQTDDEHYNTITYTGSETFITATDAVRVIFQRSTVLLTGNNATFIDMTGAANGALTWEHSAIIFTGTGGRVGTVRNVLASTINDVFWQGFEYGYKIDVAQIAQFTQVRVTSSGVGSGAVFELDDGEGLFGSFNDVAATISASESLFDIRPCITTSVTINGVKSGDDGDFFLSGTTGPIASFTDVSTSPTAVSVTNDGGDALFTATDHGLVAGELPVHASFSESSYNTTDLVVTEVPTASTYKIGIPYVSDGSGTFETTTCQVNDVAHGQPNGTCLSVFTTINFDGGYKIFNSQTDTFEITLGKAFPGSESTGNWDTSSLDQASPYVTVTPLNAPQQASGNAGSFVVGGNTTATDITTQNQFEDLDLAALAEEGSDIEMWTLTDTTTGELRYDGVVPVNLRFTGVVAASSTGGAQKFNFRLLRSRAGGAYTQLPSPDNVDVPIEIGLGSIQTASLLWPLQVEPGDKFKLNVANADGTSDVTIDTIKVEIS